MSTDAPPGLDGHYDLTDLTYEDLELLLGDVRMEIFRRDALVEDEKRRVAEDEAALKEAANARVEAWVGHEKVKCGKKTCHCAKGKGNEHGPYWYIYIPSPYTDSGRTSIYVGRYLKPEAAEILSRHEEKQEARDELLKGGFRLMRTSDQLAGLCPEEVFPENFSAEELAAVEQKRERQRNSKSNQNGRRDL